jgi:hypothetical protein
MIQPFDSEQQKEFIRRNLHIETPPELMEKIGNEKDLCSTPLHLCLFCLLYAEGCLGDIQTRTELYQELVDLLAEKAATRGKTPEENSQRKKPATFYCRICTRNPMNAFNVEMSHLKKAAKMQKSCAKPALLRGRL